MAKPIIFAIDDEPAVLSVVERDLRHKFGEQFRVVKADSGPAALEALGQLRLRNERVAVFVVDQRMPGMTGIEFLAESIKLEPEAKRVLLTAYADTDAAIRAINDVRLDHYLMKPWDPPEERLYPVLQDLLDDWLAAIRPEFEGIRVVGHRWSAASFQAKEFLARNQIPFQWLDIEADERARQLIEYAGTDAAQLPLVLLPDGTHLVKPTNLELAGKVGLRTRAEIPFYDLIIVGAGPAGLAAAVYGASEGLRTLMIESHAPGGQAGQSSRIENYLGFPTGLSGADLTRRGVAQAQRFGVEILTPQEVISVKLRDMYRVVQLGDGSEVSCHALLIATGVQYRKLDLPDIDALTGAGVYYGAAMTEALATQGQDVFVVGGGNSAGQAALYLAQFARSVTTVVRSASLAESMSQYLVDRISETPNLSVRVNCGIVGVSGESKLEAITVADVLSNEKQSIPAGALFIFIGALPRTEWIANLAERDEHGFILSGSDLVRGGRRPRGWTVDRDPFLLETNVPGIFVAGDVRHQSMKRIASAVGEGAMAVSFVHRYLATL
jgi:thioredoxin reductase (NADPH)